jgi:hypothetical protein
MTLIEFKFCENIKLSNTFFCCRKKKVTNEEDEEEVILIKTVHQKYQELLPRNKKYIFIKILKNNEIIFVKGKLLAFFNLEINDFKNKQLINIIKLQQLFIDYINPLFLTCVKNNLTYQFDFQYKNKKFSCSFYPCLVLNKVCSVDIIIRNSQHTFNSTNISQFVIP